MKIEGHNPLEQAHKTRFRAKRQHLLQEKELLGKISTELYLLTQFAWSVSRRAGRGEATKQLSSTSERKVHEFNATGRQTAERMRTVFQRRTVTGLVTCNLGCNELSMNRLLIGIHASHETIGLGT